MSFFQDEEEGSFEIYLFSAPFEAVLPWLGGSERSRELDEERDVFKEDMRQYEYPRNTIVPKLPVMGVPKGSGFQRSVARIVQVNEGDTCCVIDLNYSFQDTGKGDDISGYVPCDQNIFWYSLFHGKPSNILFQIKRKDKLIRSVMLYSNESENPNRHGRKVFKQTGEVQPYERPERYTAKKMRERLDLDLLIDYMTALGLDFEKYRRREFFRCIDFSYDGPGKGLSDYDAEARIFRDDLHQRLALWDQGIDPTTMKRFRPID